MYFVHRCIWNPLTEIGMCAFNLFFGKRKKYQFLFITMKIHTRSMYMGFEWMWKCVRHIYSASVAKKFLLSIGSVSMYGGFQFQLLNDYSGRQNVNTIKFIPSQLFDFQIRNIYLAIHLPACGWNTDPIILYGNFFFGKSHHIE